MTYYTFDKLYDKWARNVNSEYILPTLDLFKEHNYIISKTLSDDEILLELKRIKKEIKNRNKVNK